MQDDGTAGRFALTGEIDATNAGGWFRRVEPVLADADGLDVDVSQVTFVDSEGLSLLIRIRNAATERRVPLRFVGASARIRGLVHAVGLTDYLALDESA